MQASRMSACMAEVSHALSSSPRQPQRQRWQHPLAVAIPAKLSPRSWLQQPLPSDAACNTTLGRWLGRWCSGGGLCVASPAPARCAAAHRTAPGAGFTLVATNAAMLAAGAGRPGERVWCTADWQLSPCLQCLQTAMGAREHPRTKMGTACYASCCGIYRPLTRFQLEPA